MKSTVNDIKSLMAKALELRNLNRTDAEFIISDFLEAELEGKKTHGLGKFLLIDNAIEERIGAPIILKKEGSYAYIDGNKELGHIAGKMCTSLLIDMASKNGVAIVAMKNSSRYSRIKPFGRMIAEAGLVGIVTNNGGPIAVTPFNSKDPMFGTNPICFSFPSEDKPLVIDFSTSKRVWGEVRQCMLENKPLPEDTFLDKDGEFTRNPDAVEAVLPFGGAKGYALCLAIEILTGALVGAKMGKEVETQYDLGFLFIAINPNIFTSLGNLKEQVNGLCEDIRNTRPIDESKKVSVPEDNAIRLEDVDGNNIIEIDENIYNKLVSMSKSLDNNLIRNDKID